MNEEAKQEMRPLTVPFEDWPIMEAEVFGHCAKHHNITLTETEIFDLVRCVLRNTRPEAERIAELEREIERLRAERLCTEDRINSLNACLKASRGESACLINDNINLEAGRDALITKVQEWVDVTMADYTDKQYGKGNMRKALAAQPTTASEGGTP